MDKNYHKYRRFLLKIARKFSDRSLVIFEELFGENGHSPPFYKVCLFFADGKAEFMKVSIGGVGKRFTYLPLTKFMKHYSLETLNERLNMVMVDCICGLKACLKPRAYVIEDHGRFDLEERVKELV